MMDFILNYMEMKGQYAISPVEQEQLEIGISHYLLENGIEKGETGIYHENYVMKHLEVVDNQDLKEYFILYPLLSEVNQIIIGMRSDGVISNTQKSRLYELMENLHKSGLGEKYVPIIEVKKILGKFS